MPENLDDLRAEYAGELAGAIEAVGVDVAVERTGLDRSTIAAVADAGGGGDLPSLSLTDAAAIQALSADAPDAETAAEIACDHLLLGMSTAVLDVDTVASAVDLDVTPKEVQQKLERRAEMSFEEFVAIQHVIAGRQG